MTRTGSCDIESTIRLDMHFTRLTTRLLQQVLHKKDFIFTQTISYSKSVYIRKKMSTAAETSLLKPQNYDYFLVLDFEATCEENKKIFPQVGNYP